MTDFPAEYLRSLLHYAPHSGRMTWRRRSPDMFSATARRSARHVCNQWNSRNSGAPALSCPNGTGYLFGRVKHPETGREVSILLHRAAFVCMAGVWPDQLVDHINGDKLDNRWSNLRPVTAAESCMNLPITKRNTSGALGVSKTRNGLWRARCRDVLLGHYPTVEEASAAYEEYTRRAGFHENHGRSP